MAVVKGLTHYLEKLQNKLQNKLDENKLDENKLDENKLDEKDLLYGCGNRLRKYKFIYQFGTRVLTGLTRLKSNLVKDLEVSHKTCETIKMMSLSEFIIQI